MEGKDGFGYPVCCHAIELQIEFAWAKFQTPSLYDWG